MPEQSGSRAARLSGFSEAVSRHAQDYVQTLGLWIHGVGAKTDASAKLLPYQLCAMSSRVRAFAAAALLANGHVSCLRSGVKLASHLHSRALEALPLALNDFRRPLSPQIRNGHAGLRE
jgi:hypothetical protein